jgi:hypothetical protein
LFVDKSEHKITGSMTTRRVLVVLWIPSADRDGKDLHEQAKWKDAALELFGELYGGATAMPPAEGIWRDDERGGKLIKEQPILLHCYVTPDQANDRKAQNKLGAFCRRMGKETRQGEVVLLIDGEWHSFKNFT